MALGFHHLIPPLSAQDSHVEIIKKEKGRHWTLIPLLVPWKDYSTIIIVK